MSATNEPQAVPAAACPAKRTVANQSPATADSSASHCGKQAAGAYWSKIERKHLAAKKKRFALERWVMIPDYPKYQISDHGRVKGVTKILTPIKDSRGALVVSLKNHL